MTSPNTDAQSIEEIVEFGASFRWFKSQPDHNAYAQAVREWIDNYVAPKSLNAVFMDTTTVHTALALLKGDSSVLTAMTLLDLANVVSAIIANDNIFHLTNPRLDSSALNELLGNEPVFVPIPVNPNGPTGVGSLTIGHWKQSRLYLINISHPKSPHQADGRAIQNAWQAILGPGTNWQNWQEDTVESTNRLYGEESDPPAFLQEATDLFRAGTLADRAPHVDRRRVGDFITECNLRSLFNWSIAYAFNLSYVANSFRLPFQKFLYSNGEAARQYLIQFLDDKLLRKAHEMHSIEHHVRVPLFLSAILSQASSLEDVVALIKEYRADAAPLRQRKRELDDALKRQDYKVVRRLMKSMELDEKPKLWQYALGATGVVGLGYVGAALHGLHPYSLHALEVAGELLMVAGVAKVAEESALSYLYRPRYRMINKAADFASESLDMSHKVSAHWDVPIGDDFAATAQRLRDLRY